MRRSSSDRAKVRADRPETPLPGTPAWRLPVATGRSGLPCAAGWTLLPDRSVRTCERPGRELSGHLGTRPQQTGVPRPTGLVASVCAALSSRQHPFTEQLGTRPEALESVLPGLREGADSPSLKTLGTGVSPRARYPVLAPQMISLCH